MKIVIETYALALSLKAWSVYEQIDGEPITGIVTCFTSSGIKRNRVILISTQSKLIHFIGPEVIDGGMHRLDKVFGGYSTGLLDIITKQIKLDSTGALHLLKFRSLPYGVG